MKKTVECLNIVISALQNIGNSPVVMYLDIKNLNVYENRFVIQSEVKIDHYLLKDIMSQSSRLGENTLIKITKMSIFSTFGHIIQAITGMFSIAMLLSDAVMLAIAAMFALYFIAFMQDQIERRVQTTTPNPHTP